MASVLSVQASCGGGAKTRVQSKSHTWQIDEPEAFGGENTAPSPVDMLLGSLAGCVCAAGNLIAKEMGLRFSGLEITIDGEIDSTRFLGEKREGRAGFSRIQVRIAVQGEWPLETKRQWLEEVQARCPLIDNLLFPTALDVQLA